MAVITHTLICFSSMKGNNKEMVRSDVLMNISLFFLNKSWFTEFVLCTSCLEEWVYTLTQVPEGLKQLQFI